VDLDNFKTLNNTLGQDIGDLLLQEVARRLTACIRETDTVARLGGDEFVVLLEDLKTNPEDAAEQARYVVEKILASLGQPCTLGSYVCHTSASIGIVVFGTYPKNAIGILQQADIAMRQAKASGRNGMHFFTPSLQFAVNARATMERDIRHAIVANQFVLYYQPQVEEGVPIGAEALIRWRHPRRGLVAPSDFIPLAEETGLIVPVGNWVLETACQQLVAWAVRKETSSINVAVNISAWQFRQRDFVEQVLAALDSTGVNPQNLWLEITESMLLENLEEIIVKISQLKSYGLRFSLDDFGTGYSSLSYLKRLPLDQLKIDRIFVRDILTDPTRGAIAQTVVSLGRAMGLSVIAEGVETEEQREFLANLGCHAYQGYLFSRPLPELEFQQWLSKFTTKAALVSRIV
jgi:diguanylate cyclase (GGDEF)-like protein